METPTRNLRREESLDLWMANFMMIVCNGDKLYSNACIVDAHPNCAWLDRSVDNHRGRVIKFAYLRSIDMCIFYRRTPDAPPSRSRTAETQHDPRVISLILSGERQPHSSLTKGQGERNEGSAARLVSGGVSLSPNLFIC